MTIVDRRDANDARRPAMARGMRPARRRRGKRAARGGAELAVAVAVSLAAAAAGCGRLTGFPNPAKYAPVSSTVLVSADSRTITGLGQWVCGRRPVLLARSFPRKVTLTWFNPDTNCNAEPIGVAAAHAVLPAPLGGRALVQAATGTAIPYFSERDLAHVTFVPAGFRLAGDLPAADFPGASLEPGDLRTYTAPGSAARLSVTQVMTTRHALAPGPGPRHGHRLRIHGRPAELLIDRSGGVVVGRAITWIAHGYRFEVAIAAIGQHPVSLSTAQLTTVARGIVLNPSQYR